jgi:hypothetical protein
MLFPDIILSDDLHPVPVPPIDWRAQEEM